MTQTYIGVLPICKPAGWTSHDVVARGRRLLSERRIGHTGTLDPMVTGVLPLCIGRATRLVEILQELPKEYEAELTIGYATDTEDASGQVTAAVDQTPVSRQQILQALQAFIGRIEQVPPMYSAVKKDGKRLYELARQGIEVERQPRTVTIHQLELLEFDESGKYPIIRFRVRCSKGTYIRTLCVDIGKSLGYPAVMSGLVRTEAGGIRLEDCYGLEEVERMVQQGTLEQVIIPIERAISFLPSISLNETESFKAMNGVPVVWPQSEQLDMLPPPSEAELVRVFHSNQKLIGVFNWNPANGVLIANKVFT
jgi:tRNA pseudouridine55 synthase